MSHVLLPLLHLYTDTHIPLQSLGDGRELDLETRYTFGGEEPRKHVHFLGLIL